MTEPVPSSLSQLGALLLWGKDHGRPAHWGAQVAQVKEPSTQALGVPHPPHHPAPNHSVLTDLLGARMATCNVADPCPACTPRANSWPGLAGPQVP